MILVLAIQTEILSLLSRVLACDVTRNKYVGEFLAAFLSAFCSAATWIFLVDNPGLTSTIF